MQLPGFQRPIHQAKHALFCWALAIFNINFECEKEFNCNHEVYFEIPARFLIYKSSGRLRQSIKNVYAPCDMSGLLTAFNLVILPYLFK